MIETMLVLSTAHITREASDYLDNVLASDTRDLVLYPHSDYGWLILAPRENDYEPKTPHEELNAVLEFAKNLGVSWVLLDADGEILNNLPVFQ